MIHVLLKGGLGNVMFQIAAGYSHAIKLKTSLKVVKPALHFSHGDVYTKYKNNILAQIEFINVSNYLLYKEPFFHYTRLPLHSPITLDGYFQSEKYFVDYRDDILNLFKFPKKVILYTKKKYQNLLNNPLISLHVRRGDYLKFPGVHPLCTLEYYKQALSKLPDINKVLIFSDDIEWCKQNFIGDRFIFIQEEDYISLYLMSLCDYNIIANSSFSWWGAWLNQNPNKVVIAPKLWFGLKSNHNINDLIPSSWIKI